MKLALFYHFGSPKHEKIPSLPIFDIIAGVDTSLSKLIFPFVISLIKFSDPARSAPESFDSLTLLFQVDKSLLEKPNKNLSSSFGLNISNSESFLTGVRTPLSAGSNPEGYVRTGHLKASLNYALIGESILNS